MDKNPESNLIKTLNKQQDDDLSLTDKPVLVQNQLGIFFGTLKKSDSRKGTALLVDGYAISPDKHVTYAQYERLCNLENPTDIPDIDRINRSAGRGISLRIGSKIGFSVQKYKTVYNQAKQNTITDFALEGVATYRTVSDLRQLVSNSVKFYSDQNSVPLLSLSGIVAIIPISEDATVTMYDGDSAIGVPVIDTFNGAIFGTVEYDVESEVDAERTYQSASYFGEVTEPLIAYKEEL